MHRFLSSCLFSLLCVSIHTYAQDIDYRPNLIPPSPDASALGKYAEYPVGLYTGTLPITIPIHTVNDGNLSVPVSITYHASGNKVEEAASFVGLGFALNAGGAVVRSVRNLPDDYSGSGFCDYSLAYSENYLNNDPNRYTQWEQIAKGCADAEPDIFYFNFDGHTGSFSYDWSGNIIVNSPIAWKVQAQRTNPGTPGRITAWKFTSDDGTIYTLSNLEVATITNNGFPCQTGLTYNSAWYLSSIKTPNLGRTINFVYEDYTQNFNMYTSTTHRVFCYAGNPGGCQYTSPDPTNNFTQMVYACKRIKTITTSDNASVVTFNYLTPRTDEPGTGVNQLDEITIKNKDATEIRKFTFTYDYSTGRLTLKSIKKTNTDEPPYKFDYYTDVLPPRIGNNPSALSYGQDHWGYYNGKNDNPSLLPPVWKNDPNSTTGTQVFFKGGDRNPDIFKVRAGMLMKIFYPAGGNDEFWYEPHDYGFIGSQTVESLGEKVTSAGGVQTSTAYASATADAGPMTRDTDVQIWGEYGDDAWVDVEYRGAKVPAGTSSPCKVEIFDLGAPGSLPLKTKSFIPTFEITQDFLRLPKGQYRLRATTTKINSNPNGTPPFDQAEIQLTWKSRVYTTEPLKKKSAGGLRIYTVKNSAFVGDPNPTYKQYRYDDGITPDKTSSGVLNETPYYDVLNLKYYTTGEAQCRYDLRIAQNKTVLGYGPHIAYGKVTELSGYGGANGKVVYSFTSRKDYPDVTFKLPPFQQSSINTYATGNSMGAATFKKENEVYSLVNENTITNTEIQAAVSVNGLKFRFEGGANNATKFIKGTYETKFGEWYGTTIVDKEFATDAVNFVQREKNLIYSGKRLNEERLSVYRNAAGYTTTEYYYADDFTNPTTAIQSMITKNMIGLPLEIVTTVPNGFTNAITEGTFNTYSLDASSRVLLSEVKKIQTINPIPRSSFQYAWTNPSGVVDPSYITETTYDKYDNKENVNQTTGKNGLVKSALYDKHNAGPMVVVSNAPWDRIVWSGFENTDPVTYGGVWVLTGTYNSTDFATGKRSFTGTVEVNTFPVGVKYVISFWMKGNAFKVNNGVTLPAAANWTKYETIVSTGGTYKIETGAGGLVDEVRMYPADAQMNTFGYDQLVGISTETDAKSIPTFIEYDNLWRPHLLKDLNKDIIKRTNYEFEILAPLAYTLNITQTGAYAYQFQVVGGAAGYIYEFDFDDLSVITSGTASTVSHTFPSLTLTYNVKVKIKNSVNTLATIVKEVTIQKSGGSSVCSEIQNISVVRSTSNPKQVTFTVPTISGATYWWDFGDTTYGTTASEVHVYAPTTTTLYSVNVTVSAGGKSCTAKTAIKITP